MRRHTLDKYTAFIDQQLSGSRTVLEEKLNRPIDVLVWPFGIYNTTVVNRASADGYVAGFAVDCRAVTLSDNIMELPRCMIMDRNIGRSFLSLLDRCDRFAGKPLRKIADHTDTAPPPQYGPAMHPGVSGLAASSRSRE